MKRTLSAILYGLITGGKPADETTGGLMFQYKEPSPDFPAHRLFCYRRGDIAPSTTEFVTLRRELERLLPGQHLSLGEIFVYAASDGINRTGRVFSWLPTAEQQRSLF